MTASNKSAGGLAIEISRLHKSYGEIHVLRGVDLEVPRGEAFGLLGPNGTGKTTLIQVILGLLRPNEGLLRVLGSENVDHVSQRLGYLPERPRYHLQFTGREYLRTLGSLSDLRGKQLANRVDTVIELAGLEQAAERRIATYSKGMLQRLGIAQAVLHEPDLLIVDEPASGLDPGGQREMAHMLSALHKTGHTIVLCTHQLTEVARLCTRVGVLAGGTIAATATLDELYALGNSATVAVDMLPSATAAALEQLAPEEPTALPGRPVVRCERDSVVLFPSNDTLLSHVLRQLLDDGIAVRAVTPGADALEQFYLRAVQQAQTGSPSVSPPASPEELVETLIEDR
jgi:ABC-2 type transport system ATP-binding protein